MVHQQSSHLLIAHNRSFSIARYKRSAFPISLPHDLNRLESFMPSKYWAMTGLPGQPTQVIAIQPRDKLRFGYRLWLDRETGLVLRSALLDEQEQVVEQMMFTHVLDQQTQMIQATCLRRPQQRLWINYPTAKVIRRINQRFVPIGGSPNCQQASSRSCRTN
ncbi:MAG: sigma-E factor regulatory protein RseB domain-containing protein [Candidatus Competibacteraceae bacterium]